MMGDRKVDQGALFYAFSLERHVPMDHMLRSIDRFVDLDGIRAHMAPFYSPVGRPSIDPEMLIRMLSLAHEPASPTLPFGERSAILNDTHSIVPNPHKILFLFTKLLTPLRFSRQPYRQKFGLLISLRNFELSKIHPIAVYRQQSQPRVFVSPRASAQSARSDRSNCRSLARNVGLWRKCKAAGAGSGCGRRPKS